MNKNSMRAALKEFHFFIKNTINYLTYTAIMIKLCYKLTLIV